MKIFKILYILIFFISTKLSELSEFDVLNKPFQYCKFSISIVYPCPLKVSPVYNLIGDDDVHVVKLLNSVCVISLSK